MSEKVCTVCKVLKDFKDFHKCKEHFTGHKSECSECSSKRFKRYRDKNLEKMRKDDRVRHYKRTYNLEDTVVYKLVEDRTGICKICGDMTLLVVDHCHTSGKVRGLICQPCNSVLGYSRDNTRILREAIKYLENSHE